MASILQTVGIFLAVGWSLFSLALGIFRFERGVTPLWPNYLLVAQGATLLVLLPSRFKLANIPKQSPRLVLGALVLGILSCVSGTFWTSYVSAEPGPYPLLVFWFSGIAAITLTGLAWDRFAGLRLPSIPRHDVYIGLALFVASICFRAWGSDSLAGDEFLHTDTALRFSNGGFAQGVLGFLPSDGYPHLLLYVQYVVYQLTTPVLDLLTLQRWISCVCGSLSVVFSFGIVRLFSSRLIASCAGGLLVFFGWHWLNSRFIYAYPPDMALTTLSILTFAIALRWKSLLFASITGIGVAGALILQKSGLLLLPFLGYMALEEFVATSAQHRKTLVLLCGVLICALLVSYEPYIVLYLKGDLSMPLQKLAIKQRAEILPQLGLNQFTALLFIFKDAFQQFQISINDFGRHMLRPRSPILDPMFSILFSIGVVYCLATVRRSVASRLCIVGTLVFILPMALSFPLNDINHGQARRMLNTSSFLAWMGSLGAVVLGGRLVNPRYIAHCSIACCAISALFNIWFSILFVRGNSNADWYTPAGRGIQSMAVIRLARDASAHGISTTILEDSDVSIVTPTDPDLTDLPITVVKTPAAVKSILLKRAGTLQLVVIPWDTKIMPRESLSVVQELAEVIPPYLWIAGEKDPEGIPMVRYAYVRTKRQ